jgi:signal transduction histidine kinase
MRLGKRDLAGHLIVAQDAERVQIARDLHDGVCQDLAAVSVEMSWLRQNACAIRIWDVEQRLLSLQRRAAKIADNLRNLSDRLHPSVLQHVGLVAALEAHCAEVERQHRIRVRCSADRGVGPLEPVTALGLFRIAEEALRNSAKHGAARHAAVSLARDDNGVTVTLTVTDDGRGFDVAAPRFEGFGLLSIEERARLLLGTAVIRSKPGHGTMIEATVPVGIATLRPEQRTETARNHSEDAYATSNDSAR